MRGMKIIILFWITLFFLLTGNSATEAQPQPQPQQQELRFSAEKAYEHAQYLTDKIGPRPAGSKGEEKAAQYIYYILEQAGWKVKEQPFSKVVVQHNPLEPENNLQVINSRNIIAELPGQNPETVILGAHYDSADTSAPGALDNASGVGVLLEVAKVLASSSQQESYQLIFFGAEEAGLVGSEYFVTQADLSAVRWMVNLDMVGTPLEIDVAGKTSAPPELVKQVANVVKNESIPFHLSRDFLVMTREGSQGGNSDFSPFLDRGIPAVGFGISGRPNGFYHRPEDLMGGVSLQEIDQIGQLILVMLKSVHPSSIGSQTWDTSYLTFQLGSQVFILSSLGLRILFLLVFFFTGYLFIRLFRGKYRTNSSAWIKYFIGALTMTALSLVVVGLSGVGELLWQKLKGVEILWYAHPDLFILSRLIFILCLVFLAVGIIRKIPFAQSSNFYWLVATGSMLLVTTFLALYRLDLAFPFLFWLLCLDLLYLWPNIILALGAPYFIYHIHWELLNSQQWVSFYEIAHRYVLIFILLYAGLLLPVLFSVLFCVLRKPKFIKPILKATRLPIIIFLVADLLFLGLVPSYSQTYPQILRIQKEWTGNETAQYHMSSSDFIPNDLAKELGQVHSKNIYFPAQGDKPPMNLEGVIQDKGGRSFSLTLKMNYVREPYRVKIKIRSPHSFRITQIDDFLPMSKLPRKVKLEGIEKSGQYELILERTPPHKSILQASIEGEGKIQVTVEVIFADLKPSLTLEKHNLSIDYLESYRSEFEF
ncbi:M28 family metallopeptidase [Desulfitobacterium metallireducens]|uniref:Aminopeptidase n=1 Tax=Desulfitobacterium metallireducens DSM 15288 TaxID=871968 RepID=W0E7M3_9FIRM|nr:M28 family metallopeptidase [Desulfitobacterium metallireducens]AHF06762.1 aminopeptidase [Desulfitobacterium metallireducens DSM 15288]